MQTKLRELAEARVAPVDAYIIRLVQREIAKEDYQRRAVKLLRDCYKLEK